MMSRIRRSVADEPFLLIRTAASDHRAGEAIAPHAHDWHQLVHASAGMMEIWTERGSWIAPSGRAVWVPAGVRHGIRFAAASTLRTLYFQPEWARGLPSDCVAVAVSPLLRELVLRAVAWGMLDGRRPAEAAVALLVCEEFQRAETPPFDLPEPASPAMRRAAGLARTGARGPEIAAMAGMSLRALERRFRAETGLSLGRWRRHALLLAAMERLGAGEPVKSVAAHAGFAAPSAFVAAFRAAFGETPGGYFSPRPARS
ncbi:helix-turn-helix transcriptional regulator [Sphingomonas sp.]|jgi:AraC-like DNA-binding protein|uniref:AraC family transcriptional regulator n=3 Tax=unclassified Sphingomonas TaxID=196159 RepID=UPI0025FD1D0C|nr:helix-turn-helix transcriptional regulator [Sphingomonas sp.]